MGYIYTFDIGSILFLSLTIYFYVRQRPVRDLTDRIYLAMLIFGMLALVFDFAAAAMEYNAMAYPKWTLYAANAIFIASMQACLPLFFIYTFVVTRLHYRTTRLQYLIAALPYAVVLALLVISPLGKSGIFYIDGAHIYHHGATHNMLYLNVLLYVGSSVAVLLLNYRSIRRAERNVILLFVALLFIAIALQLAFPRYLLTGSATALALTSMFYVLQSPVDRINPYTGAVSRMILPQLIYDRHARNRPYTLVQFSLHSFDEIIRLYGSQLSDMLLRELTQLLQNAFPRDTVIYMDTWEFSVLCDRLLGEADVARMAQALPDTITVNDVKIRIALHVSAVPYDAAYDAAATLVTADYLLRQIRMGPVSGVLYADTACRERCASILRLEASIESILEDGVPSLLLSPIRRLDGTAAAEDAALHIEHASMQDIPYSQFLQTIGQAGLTWRYYEKLFALLAPHVGRYHAGFPVCVQLSQIVCLRDDAAARLYDIVREYNYSPQSVVLFMAEADVAEALPVLHENIRNLAALGFVMRIDAFAAGYTDLSQLTALPISAVKLDDTLIHGARAGGRPQALFTGTLQVLRDLNKSSVCAGVDTALDYETAVAAGATLLQGAYLDS